MTPIGATDMTTTQNDLSRFATPGEARVARKLVRAALRDGWLISVNDGYETTVSRSRKPREIFDALCSTGEDVLTIHRTDDGGLRRGGFFYLVYGNAENGEELISDYTANETCERIYRVAHGEA